MKKRRAKKAVSTVLATILMINTAVVAGVLLYTWSQGLFGSWLENNKIFFTNREESMDEILILENMQFNNQTTYKFNVTARNVGSRDVWISSIYLNNTNVMSQVDLAWNSTGGIVQPKSSGLHSGYYHLVVGESLTFSFDEVTPSVETEDLLEIIITTDKGTRVIQDWEVTG